MFAICLIAVKRTIGLGGWPAGLEEVVGGVLLEPPRDPAFQVPAEHGTESTSGLSSCTELACVNSCARDAHLRFEPDGHYYFYDGNAVACSVTRLHCNMYADELF